MVFPLSHKTAFVLDHTLGVSSGVQFDMDSFCKPRSSMAGSTALAAHGIPLRAVTKTIWTCAVEAITEYCRIVWDIYPGERYITLTSVGGNNVEQLNTWQQDQNLNSIMQLLMVLGPARRGTPDIMSGCVSALRVLTTPTPAQQQHLQNDSSSSLVNRGRVIVVTKLNSDQDARNYYHSFCDRVAGVNRAQRSEGLAIAHVQLVLISFIADGEPSRVTSGPLSSGPGASNTGASGVSGDVVEFQCGPSVAGRLCSLVVRHYNLASTTVTGIPMKEEQNASSSANYDVELFHPAEAHEAVLSSPDSSSVRSTRDGVDYPTVTLKWSTPRTSASHELHQCSAAYRITSVDVNSRPSSCLTNFLLNGRWVMLEMPKKMATQHNKVMSHMLAAHAGDIYIHTLLTARSVLEDPPSISEGQGGKVTDYRMADFAQLMRANLLVPAIHNGLEESRTQLDKHTKHWPITLSQTTLFSLGGATEPLTRLMVQKELTETQIVECKQVVFNLLNMEVQGENLNASHARSKGLKREDQYRAMWNELEHFLKQHNSTPSHQKVYECYLHCHNKDASPGSNSSTDAGQSTGPVDTNSSTSPTSTAAEGAARNKQSEKRSSNADQMEMKRWKMKDSGAGRNLRDQKQSLLSVWMQKLTSMEERRASPQFAGRLRAENNVTKLYVNFSKDKEENSRRK